MILLVIVESPFRNKSAVLGRQCGGTCPMSKTEWPGLRGFKGRWHDQTECRTLYARECMRDSLQRGEAPFLSHLLYTQVLDDTDPKLRAQGITAGLEWGLRADLTAVYGDFGISEGMRLGITHAEAHGRHVVYRKLFGE